MFGFDGSYRLQRFALSELIDCHYSELVLCSLVQILGHGFGLLDGAGDFLPALRSLGSFLQDVAVYLASAVVFGRLPLQGYGVGFDIGGLEWTDGFGRAIC